MRGRRVRARGGAGGARASGSRPADGRVASAWRSRPGYPYTVWSLLEMAREDIIEAMDAESVFGACDGV